MVAAVGARCQGGDMAPGEVALASYKDLCIDAADPRALGAFWAPLLGYRLSLHDDGDADLRDPAGRVQVWLNRVPEPKTVKNRLHLDISAESLQPALDGGARVIDELDRWTVLADPDGQEFCVFVRDEPVANPLYELVWDCEEGRDRDLATWWATVLGGRVNTADDGAYVDQLTGCPFDYFVFGPVPEPKRAKNRVHIDVTTAEVDALIAHGATLLRPKGDDGLGWHVLADPDGNEFCAFTDD